MTISRNRFREKKRARESVTAIATDGNGSFDVTFSDLRRIDNLNDVTVNSVVYSYYQDQNTYAELPQVGGFEAIPAALSGNTVTFYLMYEAYTTDGNLNSFPFENTGAGFITLPSQTNVANAYLEALGE